MPDSVARARCPSSRHDLGDQQCVRIVLSWRVRATLHRDTGPDGREHMRLLPVAACATALHKGNVGLIDTSRLDLVAVRVRATTIEETSQARRPVLRPVRGVRAVLSSRRELDLRPVNAHVRGRSPCARCPSSRHSLGDQQRVRVVPSWRVRAALQQGTIAYWRMSDAGRGAPVLASEGTEHANSQRIALRGGQVSRIGLGRTIYT